MAYTIEISMDYSLRCLSSAANLNQIVSSYNPDLIVLSYEIMQSRDSWNFGKIPVAYFGKNEDELEKGSLYQIPSIGICSDSKSTLENLKKEPYRVSQKHIKKKPVEKPEIEKKAERTKQIDPVPPKKIVPDIEEIEEMDEPEIIEERQIKTGNNKAVSRSSKAFEQKDPGKNDFDVLPGLENDLEDLYYSAPDYSFSDVVSSDSKTSAKKEDYIEKKFQEDRAPKKSGTKVVTVYSAKGGVGKTTIASELAVYLSLVNLGRRKLRVCIVDYNIDFGDVRATLNMDSRGMNLTAWASEIKELMERGYRPNEIHYSKEEIEGWLRKDERSGLYVLPAPISNEDSMDISSEALDIILRNLVDNGGFDVIVCDTGNNTRDSTVTALRYADVILLLMTQNVNTAICDKSFMVTMEMLDFDLSHTRLVINNIMPQKVTGMSVEEIEEYFPFECIAKIRFNADVIKATNIGEPLAFQPDHPFTRQMRNIVAFVLDDDSFREEEPEKKSLFGRLFKKKGAK